MEVRIATFTDLQYITEIYNQAIANTAATFDTKPKTIDERLSWFNEHNDRLPIFVAEDNFNILAWASLSLWSERLAYQNTVEFSVYVDENYRGKGLGKLLLAKMIEHAKQNSFHTIIARIAGENNISAELHNKHGFKHIGTMKEVGFKFNRYIDVHLYQLML